MNNVILNVKIDPELKKRAQQAAKDIGLPVSAVVAASLREFVRTRSVTFSDEPQLKPAVKAELLRLSAEARSKKRPRKDLSPAFKTADEATEWLKAETEK